jgi:ethanolamine ammonia-lyase large subunit
MMDPSEFVRKRRDRVLATILSYKEANVDRFLPDQRARDDLRRVILNNVNDFNDLVLDLLKAEGRDVKVVHNELYQEAMAAIHRIAANLPEIPDELD